MKSTTLHPHAAHAIRAAENIASWGIVPAFEYCKNRGVPISLLTLARILIAAREAKC